MMDSDDWKRLLEIVRGCSLPQGSNSLDQIAFERELEKEMEAAKVRERLEDEMEEDLANSVPPAGCDDYGSID